MAKSPPKPNKVSLSLTDEDFQILTEAMRCEKHKDLAPWIVSAALRYVEDSNKRHNRVDDIYEMVSSVERNTAGLDSLTVSLRDLLGEVLMRVATSPDDREQIEKLLNPRNRF